MEAFSFLLLIILSIVFYSAGALSRVGRVIELKPAIFDLILVTTIWGGAVLSKIVCDLNRWLLVIIWIVLSGLTGWFTSFFRSFSDNESLENREVGRGPSNIFKRFWLNWRDFSKRAGNFQSRIVLSLFFFIFISPLALILKMFSDPLKIKPPGRCQSFWHPKQKIPENLEEYKRQF